MSTQYPPIKLRNSYTVKIIKTLMLPYSLGICHAQCDCAIQDLAGVERDTQPDGLGCAATQPNQPNSWIVFACRRIVGLLCSGLGGVPPHWRANMAANAAGAHHGGQSFLCCRCAGFNGGYAVNAMNALDWKCLPQALCIAACSTFTTVTWCTQPMHIS